MLYNYRVKKKTYKRAKRTDRISVYVLLPKDYKSNIFIVIFLFFIFIAGYFLLRVLEPYHYSRFNTSPFLSVNLQSFSNSTLPKSSIVEDGENISSISSQKNDEVFFHGPRDKKRIALTFDADMTPAMRTFLLSGRIKSYYDGRITDILNQTQTKATFFLSGMWVELYPKQTEELAANPLFEVGSHSYSHPSFNGYCYGLKQIPDSEDLVEAEKTQVLLKSATHIENKLFRFPGGCYTQKDVEIIQKLGLEIIQWDVVGRDGFNNHAADVERNIISNVQNGSIIILHLNGFPNASKTADSLHGIITKLKAKGFEFVKASELINSNQATSAMNGKDIIKSLYTL